jgi:hypothetical protein
MSRLIGRTAIWLPLAAAATIAAVGSASALAGTRVADGIDARYCTDAVPHADNPRAPTQPSSPIFRKLMI